MKIVSIETFTIPQFGLVRIRTDNGYEGWGQTAPNQHANITSMVLHQQVGPYYLGADVSDMDRIGELAERCIVGEHKFPGSYVCRALAGIDTALWDLHGKMRNKSVCELVGGKRKKLNVYGSSMSREITPEEEAARLKRLKEQYGYKAFKIRIGKPFGNDVDAWPGRTEKIVPMVREAIGDDTLLFVDANSGYTPKKAIEIAKWLEAHGVSHFEEPCPYPELEWTREVKEATSIPVAGGEQDTDLAQFRRMIRMGAVDIVQPDVCYVGGFSRALKVAKMAEEAGIPCTPHAANLTMVTVFTMHLLAAIPNGGPYMEFCIEDIPWSKGIYEPQLEVKDGAVEIPPGPGWGVEICEDWLKRAEYRISHV